MDGSINSALYAAALLFLSSFFISSVPATADDGAGLQIRFYRDSCPYAEEIIRDVVSSHQLMDPSSPAGLIRLHFHDCFVRGCDASILLDRCPTGEVIEKDSMANGPTLRGFNIIDEAKNRLEEACPSTVSCADVLAFAARDAAVISGIPNYDIPSGRRDGNISRVSDVWGNLPLPNADVKTLTEIFAKKGLKQSEMVVLSGAHSIGGAHCSSFDNRLYNFSAKAAQDPSINVKHAEYLKFRCPKKDEKEHSPFWSTMGKIRNTAKVELDTYSGTIMDASYYRGLIEGKGLLSSDQALMEDARTKLIVQRMAADPSKWKRKFAKAMIRLGTVGVLVGDQGEVRRSCRFANSDSN